MTLNKNDTELDYNQYDIVELARDLHSMLGQWLYKSKRASEVQEFTEVRELFRARNEQRERELRAQVRDINALRLTNDTADVETPKAMKEKPIERGGTTAWRMKRLAR